MKYSIGEELLNKQYDDVIDEPSSKIVCIGEFKDGEKKYGVEDYYTEYANQIDFYTEEELEENFVILQNNEKKKECWYIDTSLEAPVGYRCTTEGVGEFNAAIGNCFGSMGETKQVVEKLRAFERLKTKAGFQFDDWQSPNKIQYTMEDLYEGFKEDMDLVFKGEHGE